MPDSARPRSIADLPPQTAANPASKAEGRARYFNTGNAFNVKLPAVPNAVFAAEPVQALDPATPTGLIACDVSGEMACAFPATSPLVLAYYARIRSGETLEFGDMSIETIPTPHDGVDGNCFIIAAEGMRLGILIDLGHVFPGLGDAIGSLDAVFLESNFDHAMLDGGYYPAFLKARIKGSGGHISNIESAELLEKHGERLQWACLAHLSHENNTIAQAMETHRQVLGKKLPIKVATRYETSEVFELL